jgi:tetratricopeptide (TPR) repeat protein
MSEPTLEALLRAGDLERARALAEQSLKAQPDNRAALLALARLAAVDRDLPRAKALLDRAVRQSGQDADSMLLEAVLANDRGEVHKARLFYEEIIKQANPPRAEAYFGMGRLLADKKEWAAARQHLEKAVELAPDMGVYHYHLARVMLAQEDAVKGLPALQRALELSPLHPPIYEAWYHVLVPMGELAQAEELMRKGLELLPEEPQLLNLLSLVLMERGKLAEAISLTRKLAESLPEELGVQGNLARMLLEAGQLREALALCREVAARGRTTAQLKSVEATVLESLEPPDEDGALAAWYEATRLDPNDWSTLSNLGNLLLSRKSGDKEQNLQAAIEVLEDARRRAPAQLEPVLNLAMAHAQLGQKAQARALANEVIQRASPQQATLRQRAEKVLPLLAD